MKKLLFVSALLFGLLGFVPAMLPAREVAEVSFSNTMTRSELDFVMGECVKEFGMCLNDLYMAYSVGDLVIQKVQSGVFSVELNGGGSILILLEDA